VIRTPHYRAEGDGRPAVLFLHGIGGNAENFREAQAALAPRRRTIAWNMPGYDGSPMIAPYDFAHLAEAALRVLDVDGVDRAVVVGHSFGGMVAQEMAARAPGRLAGLVLFATTAAFGGKDARFKEAFLAERLAPLDRGLAPADIAPALTATMFGPAATPEARQRAIASMARIPAAAYRAALGAIVTFDRTADLARIACPTLVLAAEHDTLAPPRTMQRMAERIPGARYVCLAGLGHLANLENPAAFAAALAAFLDTLA
jgi:3-oxoadipate enol-lactonase